jgi:serine/threonine protein kinase
MKDYTTTFNSFTNSTKENIINNINNIKKFIININNSDINLLLNNINNKIELYQDNKNIYSSLKTLYIDCNKQLLKGPKINSTIKLIKKTQDNNKILFYTKKIIKYLNEDDQMQYQNINYKEIINIMHQDHPKIPKEYLLNTINKCKKYINIQESELENILYKTDKNIYDYIYFLKNEDNPLDDKDKILAFLKDFKYEKKCFKEIDKLNLKRGFIQGIVATHSPIQTNYLLKYQPNKSVMEIILNCYIKLINNNNFLIPKSFFINSDNSYFYIIEKYTTDLYKYFNILQEKNKILSLKQIIDITIFIMNSIKVLHKNNIIHSDLKLENIVLNIDDNNDIKDIKIIDFDVGLFNVIPQSLTPIPEKYEKAFNNKKIRGTRIYMLKETTMSFKNDIFSLGVISLILLYKNIKLAIGIKCKSQNKKLVIKYQNLLKKMNTLRDGIEDNENKIKLLDLIILTSKKDTDFLGDGSLKKCINIYKEFIIDCINTKYDINELIDKYNFN